MIAYVDVINGPLLKQSNIFVFLNADERTPFQHGCNTERSASASVVENDVSRICVCPDQITTELNRLLSRVVYGALGFGRLKIDDVSWITAAVALYVLRGKISIASGELILANSLVVGFAFAHLRIVSRLRLIENAYVFVFAKWLLFRVQEVGCF